MGRGRKHKKHSKMKTIAKKVKINPIVVNVLSQDNSIESSDTMEHKIDDNSTEGQSMSEIKTEVTDLQSVLRAQNELELPSVTIETFTDCLTDWS
eukprot:Pgem_evm1s13487